MSEDKVLGPGAVLHQVDLNGDEIFPTAAVAAAPVAVPDIGAPASVVTAPVVVEPNEQAHG